MLTTFLFFLACIGVHRIWNYEDIFQGTRGWLRAHLPVLSKPIVCAVCNPFWIALGLVLLVMPPDWKTSLLLVFAAYAIMRGVVWVYGIAPRLLARLSTAEPGPPPSRVSGCSKPGGCAEKKKAAVVRQAEALSHEKRIVMLTTLASFEPGYSLVSVILDHARALGLLRPAWKVEVWALQTAREDLWPKDLPSNVSLRKVVPSVSWPDDKVDEKIRSLFRGVLLKELMALGNATVITHDLLFQSAFLSAAAAIHDIGDRRGFRWLHVAHSGPSARIPDSPRCNLPKGDHRLLVLAESHREGFQRMYDTNQIVVVPNSRSLLTIFSDAKVQKLAFAHNLEGAEFVQVYPFSTPRAEAKGVPYLIDTFKALKDKGHSVRLILANCHANQNQKIVDSWKARGLGDSLIIISEEFPELAVHGLSQHQVALLFQLSNWFIFPTQAEASSLILLEAALAGNALALNDQVPSLRDLVPDAGFWFNPTFESPASLASRLDPFSCIKSRIQKDHGLLALAHRLEAVV